MVAALLMCVATVAAQTPHIEAMKALSKPKLADGAEQIEFDRLDYSLGEISEDDLLVKGEFVVRNSSDKPIVIVRAVASCSCVTVEYPTSPIEAKGEAVIEFSYNPKGYPGKINRRIMLYTNFSDLSPTAILTISGFATASSDLSLLYPYSIGQLRLRQPSVTFRDAERVSVERIVCVNDSKQPIRLRTLDFQLPEGLSFRTEPEVIEVSAEAEIVISHNPQLWQGEAASFPLVVDGVNVAPSQRTIDIQFEYKKDSNEKSY